MDRISDSGSDGCGSIPHGGTKKDRLGLSFFCIHMQSDVYPSHCVIAPRLMQTVSLTLRSDAMLL